MMVLVDTTVWIDFFSAKPAYGRIFSDETIQEEQLEWTRWFEQTGSREGQEW